jgi:hypothetical protein
VGVESASHGGGLKTTPSVFIGGTNENGLGLALLYSGTHGDGWRQGNDHVSIDDLMLKGAYRISNTDDVAVTLHHFEGSGTHAGRADHGAVRGQPVPVGPPLRRVHRAAAPTARSSTRTTTA